MDRLAQTDTYALYGSRRHLLLALAVVTLAGLVVAQILEFSWIARMALAVLTLGGAILGLSRERLRLDFQARRLQYETRFAGFTGTRIDDGFDKVDGLLLFGGSGEANRPGSDARPVYRITLRYDGQIDEPITVATFATRADAMREAQYLCERMKVPLQVME